MKRGFSLIELLVVVAIIATLVGVATPYYSDYVKESKRAKALQDLDALKQAIVLHNAQEDLPYLGILATDSTLVSPLPSLGENDFNGLQGKYLTYVPSDPWGKNYKLDPYGAFLFSEGPDSLRTDDDIKAYYLKDLALVNIEWEDMNNNRLVDNPDLFYFTFNKSVWASDDIKPDHFVVYENNIPLELASATIDFTYIKPLGVEAADYRKEMATATTFICEVADNANQVKLGSHAVAFKEEADKTTLKLYQEVIYDRVTSIPANGQIRTDVLLAIDNVSPLRFAIRSNPIKITEK